MAPCRPFKSIRRVALTFLYAYIMIHLVDMIEAETTKAQTFGSHEFYFINQGQLVSFASESHFVVSIDLKNLTLAINHMNQTLEEARNILNHEGIKWATGSHHLSLMQTDFNLINKTYMGFLKTLGTSNPTKDGDREKRFILEAIAGVMGVATAINSGRNSYEIENIKREMKQLKKNR